MAGEGEIVYRLGTAIDVAEAVARAASDGEELVSIKAGLLGMLVTALEGMMKRVAAIHAISDASAPYGIAERVLDVIDEDWPDDDQEPE